MRVVISSSALSMGVNFPNIRYIINFGPAQNLLDQHQEFGRAGRAGNQSLALILYHGNQLSHCEQTVKDFVRNGCLRVVVYKPFDESIKPGALPHNCCSYCTSICKCSGNKCNAEALPFEVPSKSTPEIKLTRSVTEDKEDLTRALKEIQLKEILCMALLIMDFQTNL